MKMPSLDACSQTHAEQYVEWIWDEGLSLHRFIQMGGELISSEDHERIGALLPWLRNYARSLSATQPHAAARLRLFAHAFEHGTDTLPEATHHEIAFSLLCVLKHAHVQSMSHPHGEGPDPDQVLVTVWERRARELDHHLRIHRLYWRQPSVNMTTPLMYA